jgi:hypothetical protein
MKRTAINIIVLTLVCTVIGIGMAYASTKMLPKGVTVSAAIDGDVATVTISGVTPSNVQYYSYEGVKDLGPRNTFTVNLREGRRFNFTFDAGNYALLVPDMITYPPEFVGPGIAVDNSDPRGCAFIIVKKK